MAIFWQYCQKLYLESNEKSKIEFFCKIIQQVNQPPLMIDCVPKMPLLLAQKKEANYLLWFYIILCNFINCSVFIDTKQNLHYEVALE